MIPSSPAEVQVTGTSPETVPELVVEVKDPALGLLGHIVIDRSINGSSAGGVRIGPSASKEELTLVARAMTYKWGFLNVPLGGAKSGLALDEETIAADRISIMEAFGRAISPLVQSGIYFPGVDMGTTLEDLEAIMQGAGRPLAGSQIDSTQVTALTVFETVRTVVQFDGRELAGMRFAIEGFGKVAGALSRLLANAGAILVGISTIHGSLADGNGLDVDQLMSLREAFGSRLVEHLGGARIRPSHRLHELEADVLMPGAQAAAIHGDNVELVRAGYVVPIANAPLTDEAERALTSRGVRVFPDFVSNSGGVMAADLYGHGFDLRDAQYVARTYFRAAVSGVLQAAERSGVSLTETARQVSQLNHAELEHGAAPQQGTGARARQLLLEEGWSGIERRIAWRLHQRSNDSGSRLRHLALDRFMDWRLRVTLDRLQAVTGSAFEPSA